MTDIPTYEIYAVRYAKQDQRDEGHMFLDGQHGKMIPGLDFFTYALKPTGGGKSGGKIWVIDTGMTEPKAKRMGRAYDFLCRPKDALAKVGIDASKIEDLILTHAHFDHVGTLEDYPKARFHIQDEEMIHVTGRDMSHASFRKAYHPDDVKELIDLVYAGRMTFHNGDVELAPGIEFILIGGHARGQAIVRVHTKRGWVVLASDAVHVYDETDHERPFAIFYDLMVMLEGYRTMNQLAGHRDLLIPGHDARVTKAYPPAAPGLEGLVMRLDLPPKW